MAQTSGGSPTSQRAGRYPLFPSTISDVGEVIWGYEDRAARMWFFHSCVWFIVVTSFGLIIATELIAPDLYGSIPFLVFSRVRPMHVNGVIFAWLSMADFGAVFYILPRLLGVKKMWSESLAWWTAWLWSAAYLIGIVGIGIGWTAGKEYWEFIWPVDVLIMLAWISNSINIVMTVLHRRIRPLYVASWWAIASPIWMAADYFLANVMWRPGNMLGNGIPGAALTNALDDPLADVMMNWWSSHNLFGMWLTPMLIMITYYLVPKITNTPLYSHTLSLVSFWGIAFVYTSVGGHHLMQAPIPVWVRTYATVYSVMLLIPVIAFVFNIWLTMRDNWEKFAGNLPLRFVITGFVFYFLVNIQGSFQAIQSFDRMIHFTNMIISHAHLALLAGMAISCNGIILYAIPQIFRRPIYSEALANWQYWLITVGFLIFFWSLFIAGFLQGQSWMQGTPEINVLPELHPHFIGRAVGGGMVFVSAIVQAFNIYMTVTRDTVARVRSGTLAYIAAAGTPQQGR